MRRAVGGEVVCTLFLGSKRLERAKKPHEVFFSLTRSCSLSMIDGLAAYLKRESLSIEWIDERDRSNGWNLPSFFT